MARIARREKDDSDFQNELMQGYEEACQAFLAVLDDEPALDTTFEKYMGEDVDRYFTRREISTTQYIRRLYAVLDSSKEDLVAAVMKGESAFVRKAKNCPSLSLHLAGFPTWNECLRKMDQYDPRKAKTGCKQNLVMATIIVADMLML